MTEVYLVHGHIEDGMQGIPITLGIFGQLETAKQAIVKFIGDADYRVTESGSYSLRFNEDGMVEYIKNRQTYCLCIQPYTLDQATPPF